MQSKGSEDWSLKLIDFDTAVFCSVDSQTKGMTGSVFYIAPEVFDGFYNEKCDLWSCGVIMYILLSGSPPFNGLSSYQIVSRIRKGKYSLEDQLWSNISSSAKRLLQKLLEKDPKKRISAAEAFKDPWIRDLSQEARNDEEIQRLMTRLTEFNRTNKLKEAIQTFILTQVMMSQELNVIEKTFQAIDKDGDGIISKVELSDYLLTTMDAEAASRETERILGNMNGDCIEHIEFMRITVESKIWLSHENLRRAFLMFDKGNHGKLSKEEIVNILSGGLEIDDGIKEHFLQELFGDGDFEINMQSFQQLLIEKLSSRKCTN
jgi:calcium-dependent protein kinase